MLRYFRVAIKNPLSTRHCTTSTGNSATQSAAQMEEKFMKFFRTQNRDRFRMGLGVVAITGATCVFFSNDIKQYFAGHTADVAAISLSDGDLQNKVTTISKEIVRQTLTDPTTHQLVVNMLQKTIKHPDIQDQLKQLVYDVLQDEGVHKYTEDISEHVVHKLLNNEQVKAHSEQFLAETFSSDTVRDSCGDGLNAAAWRAITPNFLTQTPLSNEQSTNKLNELDKLDGK